MLIRRTLAQLTGADQHATVPRSELITWLSARLPPDRLQYSSPVIRVDVDGTLTVGDTARSFDLVVAADGTRGVVRKSLWPEAMSARSTGIKGWAWIVDRELNDGFGPIWGRTTDFGILPLGGGRTYVYGGTRDSDAELSAYRHWPAPLPDLIDAADSDLIATPHIFECRPPRDLLRGKVALIGDAAHTMRPTFGQGAALAMEDAITLANGGVAGLSQRWMRMMTLYTASKAGSYFATPGNSVLEKTRNFTLRLMPDPIFGAMAGAVSYWRPPVVGA